MSLSPLVPLLLAVSITLILPMLNAIGSRRSRQLTEIGMYGYSSGLKVFLWIGSALWIAAPFCFDLAGVSLSANDWMVGGAVDVFILSCSMYADRYIVLLGGTSIKYGAFIRKEVPYDQIVSMRLHVSNSGTKFCDLKFFGGGGAKLDGNMPGFNDLLRKLKMRVKENVPCQGFGSTTKQ